MNQHLINPKAANERNALGGAVVRGVNAAGLGLSLGREMLVSPAILRGECRDDAFGASLAFDVQHPATPQVRFYQGGKNRVGKHPGGTPQLAGGFL